MFNAVGQVVAVPYEGDTNAGEHQVNLNAGNMSTGVYYYQLCTSFGAERKQMMIIN